jgi:hypothetical protein
MTAPVVSVILPDKVARNSWAKMGALTSSTNKRAMRFITATPVSIVGEWACKLGKDSEGVRKMSIRILKATRSEFASTDTNFHFLKKAHGDPSA